MDVEYIAVGGNRHPAAADWFQGCIAYGADRNVAVWFPAVEEGFSDATLQKTAPSSLRPKYTAGGVTALLAGHTGPVNAVKFAHTADDAPYVLLSGSADCTIRVWVGVRTREGAGPVSWSKDASLKAHSASINALAVLKTAKMHAKREAVFVSGAADAVVNLWALEMEGNGGSRYVIKLLQSTSMAPKFFPLALSLAPLPSLQQEEAYILAVAGSRSFIQIFVSDTATLNFSLRASLTGHEAWIRSLDFVQQGADLLLASASQDKYIRLWRVHEGEALPPANTLALDPTLSKTLSNKAHRFSTAKTQYSVTFEALLLGHEDWVYAVSWHSTILAGREHLRLLSASADNSLALWEPDADSGVWTCPTRLGEINSQKGATTATGSIGGFWIGLWGMDGTKVASLGRTGSWRLWQYDEGKDSWVQLFAVGGHVKGVTSVAWAAKGEYILSTASDQTTRLHSEWKRPATYGRAEPISWHELSRPQIHGFDLNCIVSLKNSQFVSGADEKLLRVFSQPKSVAKLLEKFSLIDAFSADSNPDAANMPVLGLSNKAIPIATDALPAREATYGRHVQPADPAASLHISTLDMDIPPLEDHLARHTLWPESEKLYGHGYEISAVAASHDGKLIATACKASSLDHAVIRLYATNDWHEVKPSLTAHSLTVTRLRFSPDDRLLLSVGRDRQWVVFKQDDEQEDTYVLQSANPKGHTRMILDAAWAPFGDRRVFATAGRDKMVKIWRDDVDEQFVLQTTIPTPTPVTAVDFCSIPVQGSTVLAVGTEDGMIQVLGIRQGVNETLVSTIANNLGLHSLVSVTQLAWRPFGESAGSASESPTTLQLASASEDSSLIIWSIDTLRAHLLD
ncbi:MAG: hypothetical protein M1829_000513 [Trizodia sp. TS-e1964]|nr:MAG: hypothetical protein M1829_000513 [Trizodia sp. TS-e1964]